jgi:hypothetical protein
MRAFGAVARTRRTVVHPSLGLETRSVGKHPVDMDVAAAIVVVIFVVLTAALVVGLFIWAAVKDGREDKAMQARLGIRRKTRLGP